jgi:ABC-type dipeptide/oligopeptide/nickel transport system permease subunit
LAAHWLEVEAGRRQTAPQLMISPDLAISLVVLGFNLRGDGLRDLLDPRLRV